MSSTTVELVSWEGLLEVGKRVATDDIESKNYWTSNSGYQYHDGYTCIRKLHDKKSNTFFKINCRIFSSLLQRPLFECVVEKDVVLQTFIATNPTSAMKKVFNYTGIIPKRVWNGNHFFGLHRKDVQHLLNATVATDFNSPPGQVGLVADNINSNRNVTWAGVISLGTPSKNKNFSRKVGKKYLFLPPGFESVRKIRCKNEKCIVLHCKIENKDNIPFFRSCHYVFILEYI